MKKPILFILIQVVFVVFLVSQALSEMPLPAELKGSSVIFSLIRCNEHREVRGDVPLSIKLSDDTKARQILEDAISFAQEKCPIKSENHRAGISVYLYQGGEIFPGQYNKNWEVYAMNFHPHSGPAREKYTWNNYENRATIKAERELEAEKKRREMEAQQAKEERERKEALKRLNEFVKKNGVKEWPSMNELFANPFIYEGNVVAVTASFSTMQSVTKGVFENAGKPFIVSNIPKGMFRVAGQVIVLAGKVIGKTELKVPVLGQMQVPQLEFVGVHFCKDRDCSDIIRK